jgi:cold shock CspA family protein
MEAPVQIDAQGGHLPPDYEERVRSHVDELETRFGRITTCRVAISYPSGHHRTGGLFEISIHLTLPDGKEVIAARTPQNDERHADFRYALNDAFKRARRQLQDQARRLQGQVKHHEPLPTGRIARIDASGVFGFIETSDGREVYFHRNSVLDDGFARLKPGVTVRFAEEEGEQGPQASTVQLLGKHLVQ